MNAIFVKNVLPLSIKQFSVNFLFVKCKIIMQKLHFSHINIYLRHKINIIFIWHKHDNLPATLLSITITK